MRHRVRGRQLSVDSEHRLAIRRNLVSSLLIHGGIKTTVTKAKEIQPLAEKIITLARKYVKAQQNTSANTATSTRAECLRYRRRAIALLAWRRSRRSLREKRRELSKMEAFANLSVNTEHDSILKNLFEKIGPRFVDREGGYTRILKLSKYRIGDAGQLARLELLPETPDKSSTRLTPRKRARHRRSEGFEAARKARELRREELLKRRAQLEQAKAQKTNSTETRVEAKQTVASQNTNTSVAAAPDITASDITASGAAAPSPASDTQSLTGTVSSGGPAQMTNAAETNTPKSS